MKLPCSTTALRTLMVATLAVASPLAASALETRPVEMEMQIGSKAYSVTAEPLSSWQLSSEGQLSLDQKFDIQPDGSHGLIQVKLVPTPAALNASNQQPNPCTVLQGLAKTLEKDGVRVSPGRKPQANLAPVCSMVTEGTLQTQFFYASIFKSGDIVVAGIARNTSDLDDAQITEFQRYLASIKATPKETTQ
jgi:hypothetical protein